MHLLSRKMFFPLVGALAFVCAVQAADPPMPEQTPFAKCRYISFQPTNPGVPTALRVTLSVLPAPFQDYEGMQLWVTSPFEVVDRLNPPTTIQVARLGNEPVYLDWSQVGLLNVGDSYIVPGATFSIDAIEEGCDLSDPSCYSTALSVNTAIWGDVTAGWNGSVWTAPDGSIDITSDAIAVLEKFRNTPTAIPLVCADLYGNVPSLGIDIIDVVRVVEAFRGRPYAFSSTFGFCEQRCRGNCNDGDPCTRDSCCGEICAHRMLDDCTDQLAFEIGPIEGFTTAWHPAPAQTALPLGAILKIKQHFPADSLVTWSGAAELARDATVSTAECSLTTVGSQLVRVTVTMPNGEEAVHELAIDVMDISPAAVEIGAIAVSVAPFDIGETSSNQATMGHFFGESIAGITQIGEAAYRTSIDRSVIASTEANPPGFSPLIEWRAGGVPVSLGRSARVKFFDVGDHVLSAGPPDYSSQIDIETYRVTITSHEAGLDIVAEGESITFTAVTEPPGFEDDITWLSSTKFGTASPVLGSGSTFNTEFNHTYGPDPDGGVWQWVGVRADNANFGQDQKAGACCFLNDDFCDDLTPDECAAAGATFLGQGTTCETSECPGSSCDFTRDFELVAEVEAVYTGAIVPAIHPRIIIEAGGSVSVCAEEMTLTPPEDIEFPYTYGDSEDLHFALYAYTAENGFLAVFRDPGVYILRTVKKQVPTTVAILVGVELEEANKKKCDTGKYASFVPKTNDVVITDSLNPGQARRDYYAAHGGTVIKVANVAAAITYIRTNGPFDHVVFANHGSEGLISAGSGKNLQAGKWFGKDAANNKLGAYAALVDPTTGIKTFVTGKIQLIGCGVGDGVAGQHLAACLANDLGVEARLKRGSVYYAKRWFGLVWRAYARGGETYTTKP